MALSTADLVQRVRDLIQDHPYETTSTTTTTSATVAVTDGTRWEEGDIGEWQTGTVGYEQFYVQSVSVNNLTTVRGYAGTTAETHTSGDRVVKLARQSFTGRSIQQAINQSILAVWPYMWKTGTVSLTYVQATEWYDLNSLTLGIVDVQQVLNSTTLRVGIFRDPYFGMGKSYTTRRTLPTSVVASGNGITFPQGVYDSRTAGGNAITVTDIRAITGSADIEDSTILPMAEILTNGALARLLRGKEILRVTQGAPLEPIATTGPGDRVNSSQWFEREFRNGLEVLRVRLQTLYSPDEVWAQDA